MKILLIYPPGIAIPGEQYYEAVPLGVAYLAAVLEKEGHQVKIIDALVEEQEIIKRKDGKNHLGMSWKKIRKKISQFEPALVGISVPFSSLYPNAETIARIVKNQGNIPVVVGGAHPSAVPEEVLKDKNIDFVILGEGEYSMRSLVECLDKNSSFRKIDGLGYKKRGTIFINPKTSYIENPDELPFPARHLLPMERYFASQNIHAHFSKRQPSTSITTSRGCPGQCTFCSIHTVWGRRWRSRSPKNVVDEIEMLVKNYGVKEIHFEDDNLTLDRKRMTEICEEIIGRGLDITWTAPNGTAIQTLDEELLTIMKQAGCYRLFLAIESGNRDVLQKLIKKGLSLVKVKEVVKILKKLNLETTGFFVLGMPGETKENIRETIDLAKALDLDDAWFSIATPFPGTALYQLCQAKGYLETDDCTKMSQKRGVITTPTLSAREVEKLHRRAYLEYQLNKFIHHPLKFFNRENRSTLKWYSRVLIGRLTNP